MLEVNTAVDYFSPPNEGVWTISGSPKWYLSCQLGDYMLPIPPFTFEPEKSIDRRS